MEKQKQVIQDQIASINWHKLNEDYAKQSTVLANNPSRGTS